MVDESVREGEDAAEYVKRLADAKSRHIANHYDNEQTAILAADTAVVIDGIILGKPIDHEDARRMLRRLSGARHKVMTGICVHQQGNCSGCVVTTQLEFIALSDTVLDKYLATDEPWDKAGSYAIQGLAGAFVQTMAGSYSNVVGLPLTETWQLLSAAGIATALDSE